MVNTEGSETQRLIQKNGDPASKHDSPDYQSVSVNNSGAYDQKFPEKAEPDKPGNDRFSTTQRKLLACLSLVTLLNGSLIAVMIPFFPVEAASRGVSQTVISGVFSCFAIVKMMLNPLVGRLAPKIGVSRLYNIGLALAGVSTLVFGVLDRIEDTQTFIFAVFAVRLIEAAGSAAISTCGFTIAGSEFGSRVTTAVAVIGSSLTAGLALTPALWGGLYAVGGFGTPFYTLGAVMLLTSAALTRLIPDIESADCQQAPFVASLLKFLGAVDNWLCLATILVFAADVTTVESAFAVYSDQVLGVPPSLVGIFFLVSTTLYALVNPLWARLSEKRPSPFPQMAGCLIASSVGIIFIAPAVPLPPHWLITGAGMIFEELFIGGAFTPCFKAMLDASVASGLEDSVATKAFVSSLFHATFSLGIAVGPVSGGAVIDRYGFAAMTAGIGAMTALLGVVMAVRVLVKR
ncbi:MFS-type transporter SLC18B1-like [Amphibalanus amphitrite]|uniref:MFS-type transporter SLC18B1-like n=1 Tax=Amphibalanus amphitrite TaxID=1232801 RepID=UPI001C920DCD|nr:MFS-type transporter SLC18B1-like [Amphibalanus amphitrite]